MTARREFSYAAARLCFHCHYQLCKAVIVANWYEADAPNAY